jgi:hypothetical protein
MKIRCASFQLKVLYASCWFSLSDLCLYNWFVFLCRTERWRLVRRTPCHPSPPPSHPTRWFPPSTTPTGRWGWGRQGPSRPPSVWCRPSLTDTTDSPTSTTLLTWAHLSPPLWGKARHFAFVGTGKIGIRIHHLKEAVSRKSWPD